MTYLYHIYPTNLEGDVLYPLNVLERINKPAFELHSKKYVGREGLKGIEIPLIKCLWNDVIHLCPVDIKFILNALVDIFDRVGLGEELGLQRYRSLKYFKIDVGDLNQDDLYLFKIG